MLKPSDPVQALLLVDVQQAFVTGDSAVPGSSALLERLRELLRRARQAGTIVAHLQNDGPAGAVDAPGQPGWDLHFTIAESEHEIVIRKLKDDGFDGTELGDLLQRHGIHRICIVGVMSEMCVLATARTALERGLSVVIPHDGHATYDIGPAPGASEGVPAASVSRVAEWALGDTAEIVAYTTDVSFGWLTRCRETGRNEG